jgi:hypothetical protein
MRQRPALYELKSMSVSSVVLLLVQLRLPMPRAVWLVRSSWPIDSA